MATATSSSASFRTITIGEIARLLDATLVGDASTLITSVGGLESAAPGAISFIDSEKRLTEAIASSAAAFIAPESLRELLEVALKIAPKRGSKRSKPIVFAGNPRLAFAKVLEFMEPSSVPEKGIHPTAVIESDAIIGDRVTIREGCYVGHHARIGDGAILYPHVVVGDGAQIGAETTLFASVVIYRQIHIGKRVRIHSGTVIGGDGFGYVFDGARHQKIPQVGTVIIEDEVEIGANVCIDRATMGATRIGEGTKIDNLVQIAHNVQIGKNCILCGLAGISGSVVIEDNVMIAGQVGVRDHTTVGKGAIVGAQAGIISDVTSGEFVVGAPAMPQGEFMRIQAASRKLPDMARQLRRLEKQIDELNRKLESREMPA